MPFKRPRVYVERALRRRFATKRSTYRRTGGITRQPRVSKALNTMRGVPYVRQSGPGLNAGFPQRMYTVLTFFDNRETAATSSGLMGSELLYRPNSAFDPLLSSGTGNSAIWWTTLTNIYSRYIVLGAEVDIVATNRTNSGFPPTLVVNCQGGQQGFTLTGKDIRICG